LAWAGSALAQTGSLPRETLVAEAPKPSAAPMAEPKLAERPKPRSLHQFKDTSGTMTFTNRPDKYKRRSDFVEVNIRYERIPLPMNYRSNYSSVKNPVSSAAKSASANRIENATIKDIVRRYSSIYGLEDSLIYAVIKAESAFNPTAVSSAGARGLMQLMPGTALEMGVDNIFDPWQNVAGGTQYLAKMMEIFGGKKHLAVAAYNAGPENVKKYNGIPPFEETQNYVKYVLKCEQAYKKNGYVPDLQVDASKHYRFERHFAPSPTKGAFTVCFHSGLTQPADSVEDKEPYWIIVYANRSYPVRKDLVKSIDKVV
jgi:hypothetical protein